MLPKRPSEQCSRFAGRKERGLSPGRIDPKASRPTQPRTAPLPRRAPLRPDRPVMCPGFGSTGCIYVCVCMLSSRTCLARKGFTETLVKSKTRTHYRPVESGRRTAGRRGRARLSMTGRRRADPARRQPSLLLSCESKTLSWTSLRKHEQTKS